MSFSTKYGVVRYSLAKGLGLTGTVNCDAVDLVLRPKVPSGNLQSSPEVSLGGVPLAPRHNSAVRFDCRGPGTKRTIANLKIF